MAETQGGGIGGGLGSAIGGIIGLAGQKSEKKYFRLLRNMMLELKENQPDLLSRDLAPAQLSIAGEYLPQTYDAQFAGDPTQPEGDPRTREEQMGALRYLGQMRDEGLPLAERLVADEMQREVSGEAQRAQQAVLRNLAERGRLSGGDEIAARIQANQQASELARGSGSDLARQAVLNRFSANESLADLASGVRSQDFGESAQRANVLNDFNQWASNLMTQSARDSATMGQQAQFANIGRDQQVSDQNENNRREAALENLMRENLVRQQEYENRKGLFGDVALPTYQGLTNIQIHQNDARVKNAQGIGQGIGQAVGAAVGG